MKGALTLAAIALGSTLVGATPSATRGPLEGRPNAVIDLDTAAGLSLVRGTWETREATPPTEDTRPGTGAFDSASWTTMTAGHLQDRLGPGRTSSAWYRLRFVIPPSVGALATAGTTAVFEIVVDDYAEIWVNGVLARTIGQSGGSLIAGFNAPNRVVLTRDARPGQAFDVAVFALNGPISDPPANRIWVRSASVDFYRAASGARTADVRIDLRDARLAQVLPSSPIAEHLASGFQFTEGPVWVPADRSLLFSDPNENTIYRWQEDGGVSVFRVKSGYSGMDIGEYRQPGSNGLTLDAEGRLTIAEHGRRRIVRIEKHGATTVLADRFEGRRLNSPNDLVYKSDGALYFTDPPFGLPKVFDDARKELPFSGVFRLKDGQLTLLARELTGPNGIAFSPDERHLYVANWDEARKVVMRYDVLADGTLGASRVFFDMTGAPGDEALDGVKVDAAGNLYVSGPGGLWIIGPEGVHLGTIVIPELAANMAWGDEDGKTLYLTARTGLYRLRTLIGRRPSTESRLSR